MLEFYPGHQWHDIGDGISWRTYKHWGTGVYAGEGREIVGEDRSGCKRQFAGLWWTSIPTVVEARLYCLNQDIETGISAVFSYPGGIGIETQYFWEILNNFEDDIERFMGENAEREMEQRVRKLFTRAKTNGED